MLIQRKKREWLRKKKGSAGIILQGSQEGGALPSKGGEASSHCYRQERRGEGPRGIGGDGGRPMPAEEGLVFVHLSKRRRPRLLLR